jgi:ATP/maltotriose-dependent transcriptional regulator MalT
VEPSISSTKIRPPRLPALSLRPRLFGQLQQACHHPVIWISGPPGAGKTALLKSFIDSRALPAFWYRFDQTDNDPQRFFHYCQCVVKQLDRGTAATLPDFCTLVTEPAVFSPGFFAAMFEQLPTPMTLVFDDYQR